MEEPDGFSVLSNVPIPKLPYDQPATTYTLVELTDPNAGKQTTPTSTLSTLTLPQSRAHSCAHSSSRFGTVTLLLGNQMMPALMMNMW